MKLEQIIKYDEYYRDLNKITEDNHIIKENRNILNVKVHARKVSYINLVLNIKLPLPECKAWLVVIRQVTYPLGYTEAIQAYRLIKIRSN